MASVGGAAGEAPTPPVRVTQHVVHGVVWARRLRLRVGGGRGVLEQPVLVPAFEGERRSRVLNFNVPLRIQNCDKNTQKL